jgi:uncharacterized protein with beta-barrel porin domain
MHTKKVAKYISSLVMLSASLQAANFTYTVNSLNDTVAPFGTFTPGGGNTGTGNLRGCLTQIDNNTGGTPVADNYTITFSVAGPIVLGQMLPVVNAVNTGNIIIDGSNGGNPIVIDGANTYRAFLVRQGNVTIENMTIQNTKGSGGTGSGGGMGAGGAVFVYRDATVTLENVSITNAQAAGGTGGFGNGFSLAGGGMGGNGGSGFNTGQSTSGGGGGGIGGNGGNGNPPSGGGVGQSGGGGGGIAGLGVSNNAAGGDGTHSATLFPGTNGGIFATGTEAGNSIGSGTNPGGAYGGGGAGAQQSPTGYGFGGAGGGIGGANTTTSPGGAGGFGGGGGGGGGFSNGSTTYSGPGGPGGFGGGGGGSSTSALIGASGGFGGGGAGAPNDQAPYTAGAGGSSSFGGGGGGGTNSAIGGIGGGTGSDTGGGGGAGLGGAIFVMQEGGTGGTLILNGGVSTQGCGATAGGGASVSSTAGAAAGSDLFLMTGTTTTLTPGTGETITIAGSIGDDSATTLPGPGYNPGVNNGVGLMLNGAGTVVFSGTNTYARPTIVNSGTFSLTGSVAGNVTVDAPAIFKGTGNVDGVVTVNGMLSPGNSIGTMTVGSATFNSTSVFNVETSPTAASLLQTTGGGSVTVNAGAILQITEDPGNYTVGTQYTIISAPGGVITGGDLFTIQSLNPGFGFSLLVDPTMQFLYLLLTATPSPTFTTIDTTGLTGNNLKVANYLNSLVNYAPLQPILADLSTLPLSQLNQALSTIDPARNAFSTFMLQNLAFTFSDIVSSRLSNQRFAESVSEEDGGSEVAALIAGPIMRSAQKRHCATYSTWGSVFGSFAHEKEQDQTPAFNMSAGGVLVGFDAFGFSHATIGGTLGYAHIDINEDNHFGHQQSNDYVASVYTDFYVSNFFLDLAVWGGYHHTDGKRHVFFPGFNENAHSKTHGWQVVPHMMLGYDIETCWSTFEPFAQIDWAVNFEHAFKEYGAGVLNMSQKAHTSSLLRSEVGLAAFQTHTACNGGLFVIREKLSYVNKKPFHSGRVTAAIVGAPGGSFTVETLTGTQNMVSPGLELYYQTPSDVFISATYEGEFGSGYRSNSILAKIGKAF